MLERWLGVVGATWGLLGAASAVAGTPQLQCRLEQGGEQYELTWAAVRDPYSVSPKDVGERFRFKAVVVGDEAHLDHVALYVYYRSDQGPVLLQQAKFLTPPQSPPGVWNALTGTQYLYAPPLEWELRYGCSVGEVAP